jgi:serine/threonine protein kinase
MLNTSLSILSIGTSASTERLDELVAEMTALLEAGQDIDVEALSADSPSLAEQLRQLLPTLQAVVDFRQSSLGTREGEDGAEEQTSDTTSIEQLKGILGDFRIVREIGRGGMGVVYEAEQLSIGRRVALKVLPFAAMLDRQQLNRFKNEARAAGTLDHPNIVAIHSVGCERGVHYYAMQLIEGQSLAEMVEQVQSMSVDSSQLSVAKNLNSNATDNEQLTTDTSPIAALSTLKATRPAEYCRIVAQLGIQAAEALDHAHQNGILHRDIKPANLLVECTHLALRDGASANAPRDSKLHHAERDGYTHKLWITDFGLARLEADVSMTMTGDILGTLRYMSPEQALGKRAVVDHRSDIYSLGVTLYELLTGRPTFDATDRGELLRAIAELEPPRVRTLAGTVSIDLETIVHKAMEKDPSDRYSTAGELAADLRRFVEDRPIVARRRSLWHTMRKLVRRHASLVAVSGAALALAAVGLLVGTLLLSSAYRESAQRQLQSQANLQLAAEAVDQLLFEMGREASAYGQLPQAERILGQAARFYQQFIEKSNDAVMLCRAATARNHIGALYRARGRHELAIEEHQAALALLNRSGAQQDAAEILQPRAAAYDGIGLAYMKSMNGMHATYAQAYIEHARAIWQQLVDRHPGNAQYLVELVGTLNNQALVCIASDRLDEAESTYRLILELSQRPALQRSQTLDRLNTTAGVTCNLGMVAVVRGRLAEAEPLLREAITIQEKVVSLRPGVKQEEYDLYQLHWSLVDLFVRQGKHTDASTAAEQLVERFPDRMQSYVDAANLLLRCVEYVDTTKDMSIDDARPANVERYRQAARRLIGAADRLRDETPDCLESLAWFLVMCRDKSLRDPARALALADASLKESPELDSLHRVRGVALYRLEQYQSAVQALQRSARSAASASIADALFLAMSYWQLGNQEEARKWYAVGANRIATPQPKRLNVYDDCADEHEEILAEAKELMATNTTKTAQQE